MPIYNAPTKDIQFLLHDVLKVSEQDIEGFDELDRDFTAAVIEEAGKVATEVLLPLNIVGDTEGCTLENGVVRTPTGFDAAFKAMKDGGWTAMDCDPEYGGQGLPYVMHTAAQEPFVSANMAFNMYQGLTHGAYTAIHIHGTDEQKAMYLPKMVSCEWTGTMNLTEPHCGTDLGLMRTKAEPQDDGSYAVTGSWRTRRHQRRQPFHRAKIHRQRRRILGRSQPSDCRQDRRKNGYPRQLNLCDGL